MCPLSNKAGSNNTECTPKSHVSYDELAGWDAPTTKHTERISDLISIANQKISLASVLKSYKIQFIQEYSPSGWNFKTCCPFPDHSEKTPSFGFNSKKDIFNCFGCQRGGRAVQCIAAMEDKDQIEVAEILLKEFNQPTDDNKQQIEIYDDSKILEVLLEFLTFKEDFLKKNPNKKAEKLAEELTYSLELFIRKYLAYEEQIKLNVLKSRITKMKKYLERFEVENG